MYLYGSSILALLLYSRGESFGDTTVNIIHYYAIKCWSTAVSNSACLKMKSTNCYKYEQGRLWFQAFTTCMPWPHRRNMWCVNNGLGYMNNPKSRGTLQKISFRNLFKFLLKHTSLGTLYRCMYTLYFSLPRLLTALWSGSLLQPM